MEKWWMSVLVGAFVAVVSLLVISYSNPKLTGHSTFLDYFDSGSTTTTQTTDTSDSSQTLEQTTMAETGEQVANPQPMSGPIMTDDISGMIDYVGDAYNVYQNQLEGEAPKNLIPVDNCMIIDKPGDYILTKDLAGYYIPSLDTNLYAYAFCIKIQASDVSLDCDGHKITGQKIYRQAGESGIRIDTTLVHLDINNVGVSNCDISGYAQNIHSIGYATVNAGIHKVSNILLQSNVLHDGQIGIKIHDTTHSKIVNNKVYNNAFVGISEDHSEFNIFSFNTIYNHINIGLESSHGTDTIVYANQVYGNDYGILSYDNDRMKIELFNDIHDNNVGVSLDNSLRARLSLNFIHNNAEAGIEIKDPNDIFDEQHYFLGSNHIYRNGYGIRMSNLATKSFSVSMKDHYFGNKGPDVFISDTVPILEYSPILSFVVLDNPKGDFKDYTKLSIIPKTGYDLKWSPQPAQLPIGVISFANKFIRINPLPNQVIALKEVTLYWDDAELQGYDENKFYLARYDLASKSWVDANAILDTTKNTLVMKDLTVTGVFGILQKKADCTLIDPSKDPALTNLPEDQDINFNSGTDYCLQNGYNSCSYISAAPNGEFENLPCNTPIACAHVAPNQNNGGQQVTSCFTDLGEGFGQIGPVYINCCK